MQSANSLSQMIKILLRIEDGSLSKFAGSVGVNAGLKKADEADVNFDINLIL